MIFEHTCANRKNQGKGLLGDGNRRVFFPTEWVIAKNGKSCHYANMQCRGVMH